MKHSEWRIERAIDVGVLSLLFFLVALFPGQAHAKKLIPVHSDPAPGSGLSVVVRNEQGALSGAQVWVESLEGRLLVAGQTAQDGRFLGDVSEEALRSGVSITAAARGHSAVSFLENVAHHVVLELPILPPDAYSTLTGRLTGFRENDDESKAMVGLVAKAMHLTDLVQLDSSSFISPLKDYIDVLGRREIPSNIVLPEQTFPIYFFPIRVNKPSYRLPVLQGTSSRYFGVSGTVDVQGAINAIRGNDAWRIVNLLEFNKAGITREVPVPRAGQTIRMDVVSDQAVQDTVRLRPGRNTTSGKSRRLALSLWEPIPGTFVPTDVKLVEGSPLSLTAIERATAKVMDILITEDGDHYRGAWVNTASAMIPDAGLSADLLVNAVDGSWTIRGGETAQLLVAHVETYEKTSVGGNRYADKWVLVGPRRAQLRLPAVALRDLRSQLGKISHVSVDLLQMTGGGYPLITGEIASGDLAVVEKVRREIK